MRQEISQISRFVQASTSETEYGSRGSCLSNIAAREILFRLVVVELLAEHVESNVEGQRLSFSIPRWWRSRRMH